MTFEVVEIDIKNGSGIKNYFNIVVGFISVVT